MNLWSIPAEMPFLPAIAADWLQRCGGDPIAVARGLIVVPTRRSARALATTFLSAAHGKSLLLPRIVAVGAMDEAPLSLAGILSLPPAVDQTRRLAELARLILGMGGRHGAPRTADRAWLLAKDLASLMDEAELAEIDLARALPSIDTGALASHWQVTVDFLSIVTRHWPDWLQSAGLLNPAARRVALIDAQAAAWRRHPPSEPILAAGIAHASPSLARLLTSLAHTPHGRVVLAGLDHDLDEESWASFAESHPQAGLRTLLMAMSANRADVQRWPAPLLRGRRESVLSRAMRPACSFVTRSEDLCEADGMTLLRSADQQEEAVSIALRLRHGLEQPGVRVALVTPDRGLARRVAAELLRWGIIADDSAGEPLSATPPAVFLRLLAKMIAEEFAPVALLAVLKHPLFAAGLHPAAARSAARALELTCLRGPRPGAGLPGLRRDLDRATPAGHPARDLVERLTRCLEPLLRVVGSVVIPPAEALSGLIQAAEALGATDTKSGPARLWALEEGEALAATLAAALDSLSVLPDQPFDILPGLLDAMLDGQVVRSQRALRGRDGHEHPRVFIWGLLEARLQSVDLIVLGGLTEGVWPPAVDPGPWMSRQMRTSVGLPSPEERIGETAHDFTMSACAAATAVLSLPFRRDGAPTIPARWLTRLEAILPAGLPQDVSAGWAAQLDRPCGAPRPVEKPRPCPPVALRPRALSVTEIETWLADPYAIYARHILRVRPLDMIEQSADAADYGSLVHSALHRFMTETRTLWPPNAAQRLQDALIETLGSAGLRRVVQAWWEPRLRRIAEWIVAEERQRRSDHPLVDLAAELSGRWDVDVPRGFRLNGRIDRIEKRADGRLAILDYKTGTPPRPADVASGAAPQLSLEAVMATVGAFGPEWQGSVAELTYWHLSGGLVPGRTSTLFAGDEATLAAVIADATSKLRDLIQRFDDPTQPYLAQPHPGRLPRYPEYAQLARVAEWREAEALE